MTRRTFEARADGVHLVGWVEGSGQRVLLLHGGPGLSFDYLDGLRAELGDGHEVAAFQQRGLAPSQDDGPFSVADHVAEVRRVLDALGWDTAVLVGHSWGGHLALHAAAALPERCTAVLAVDPLGATADGGAAAFEAEMLRRTPDDVRQRAAELDERAMRGEGTEEDAIESMRLVWPAYFPTWDAAPPMPPMRISVPCYAGTLSSLVEQLPSLEAQLSSLGMVGFVCGQQSPMPTTAATETAERIPGAWVDVVPSAGHLPWLDRPGCVRSALGRLNSR